MQDSLKISISLNINNEMEDTDLIEAISTALENNEHSFTPRTSKVCKQYDLRAEYCDSSLVISDIELDRLNTDEEDKIVLDFEGSAHVTYDWFAHYGCKDMSGGDEVEDTWRFQVINNKLNLLLEIPVERYDEI